MKFKVCGMKYADNIQEITELIPDYMGFIFYEKSARYVGNEIDPMLIKQIPKSIKKVAVFVNADLDEVVQICRNFKFDYAQIHGDETADYCKKLQKSGIKVIKAFQVDTDFDFIKTKSYKAFCDFFLFDTKTTQYGGSGVQFNWEILKNYDNEVPFFLSGGIGLDNIDQALKIEGLNIEAFDLNSKFEIEPGRKEQLLIEKLKLKIEKRNYQLSTMND